MKIKGALQIEGFWTIRHMRGDKILSEETIHNTTTNVGFKEVAGLINEQSSIGFKWLALDNSGTAAAAANTTLASEITDAGLGKAAATCSKVTTTVAGDTAQLLKTFTATATKTVRGAGVFDTAGASTGVLLARSTFSAKNMEANDTLQVTYKIKVA